MFSPKSIKIKTMLSQKCLFEKISCCILSKKWYLCIEVEQLSHTKETSNGKSIESEIILSKIDELHINRWFRKSIFIRFLKINWKFNGSYGNHYIVGPLSKTCYRNLTKTFILKAITVDDDILWHYTNDI